jgi:hypothetical protein
MVEQKPTSPTPILPYETPAARPKYPVLGLWLLLLAIGLGLFGGFMLFAGIGGMIYVFSHADRPDIAGDWLRVALFTLIGAASLFAALRWMLGAFRMVTGR